MVMVSRRLLLGATLACLLVGALGLWLFIGQRIARCAPTPANPNLVTFNGDSGMPVGWGRAAGGVELRGPAVDGEGFDLDGDGRALQLIGIGNYAETPAVAVRPGAATCFSGFALSDSGHASPTRARLVFQWRDADGTVIQEDATLWQPVVLWTPEAPPRDWAPLLGGFIAPGGAATLAVRVEPASDDRIYLDLMALRAGGADLDRFAAPAADGATPLRIAAWPLGRRAAVAFTFDWETAMGGLVHSRSVGDPNVDQDYLQRAARMRQGITTTLELFAPLELRATYYATGYNFLLGNREQRRFLGDPTFPWATRANGWTSDRWVTTPWFADDPFGTVQTDPAWYFGDLVEPLLNDDHEIQSHTFSHLHGGLADLGTWQLDLQTWNNLAAERGVAPARSLAFPWSSSAGMSDRTWTALEQAGITSVTRLSDQAQYSLWQRDDNGLIDEPHCRWVPGRERSILACPDFYLTPERISPALRQIDLAVAAGGMIDLWAHTEEVVTPEQVATWTRVARRVAQDPQIWAAPLSEVADWQAAVEEVRVEQGAVQSTDGAEVQTFTLSNPTDRDLVGLSIHLPATTQRVLFQGEELERFGRRLPRGVGWWPAAGFATIDLAAGQTVEIEIWRTL
jgi:hypothetical protein